MNKEKIQEKLKKIKALADNGVAGEKEGAQQLYEKLLAKYNISEDDVVEEKLTKQWFKYKDELSRRLLIQICYKVTGCNTYYVKKDKRHKQIGIECTDFEFEEIVFYYNFYIKHFREELDIFVRAFMNVNSIFPDSSARCYEEDDTESSDLTPEEIDRIGRVLGMARNMEKKTPAKQIEQHR